MSKGRIDEAVINFQVYENGTEYYGMAEVTLPEISYITESISGAGIAGNIESIILGHIEAMTLGLNFRTTTKDAVALAEPREHQLELRVAQQNRDTIAAKTNVVALKHVFVVKPKQFNPGKVAPASPADASGEYGVSYWKMTINGEPTLEIDVLNMIFFVNGTDYLEPVRVALGKS